MNNFDQIGAADCYLKTADCGGRAIVSNNMAYYARGEKHTVLIQKNLDHNPGNFNFTLHLPGFPSQTRHLAFITDTPAPSLSFYYVDLQIPLDVQENTQYFLQVVYNTKTPSLKFYQCADIYIKGH